MDKDEALKLALEVLEKIYEGCGNVIEDKLHENAVTLAKLVREDCNKPITAIKEALAQPEQESDDLTIAYMAGLYDGKNKYAPQRQPEQEPVAWRSWNDKDKFGFWDTKAEAESWCDLDFDSEPLYTIPPPQREWVGLTDEERDHFEGLHLYAARNQVEAWIEGVPSFIDAIEAKLREKNTC